MELQPSGTGKRPQAFFIRVHRTIVLSSIIEAGTAEEAGSVKEVLESAEWQKGTKKNIKKSPAPSLPAVVVSVCSSF